MRWLGENPFHTLLLWTARPADWAVWQIAPLPLVIAALSGWLWARVTGQPGAGWGVALGLLALALADWALLAALPRKGLSFGAVQPPWLGLVVLRGLSALLALPLAARWPGPTLALLILAQILLSIGAWYGTHVEPFRLQTSHLEIQTAKWSNSSSSVRIVQISDLHIERLTRRERALPALAEALQPDLIALTGDFLSTSYRDDPRALSDLSWLLGQLRAPAGVWAVWGTAEVDLPPVLRPVLEEAGVVVLEDQAREVEVRGQRLWLMGLRCLRQPEEESRTLACLLSPAPADAVTVLLYHVPDLMPQAAALGVDLFLTGHTHGGQWRLPCFGALLTSSRYWKRYEAGHYRQGRTHLYVSRGLGLEGFGTPRARFFCPPELVAVTIRAAEKRS